MMRLFCLAYAMLKQRSVRVKLRVGVWVDVGSRFSAALYFDWVQRIETRRLSPSLKKRGNLHTKTHITKCDQCKNTTEQSAWQR